MPSIPAFALILVVLTIVALTMTLFRQKMTEGFTQSERFVLKTDGESYDDFYAKVYDRIHLPEDRTTTELSQILKITGADDNSVFLDVGTGTGETLRHLSESGAKCVGIEKSPAMVAQAATKTDAPVKQSDVLEPMAFERASFTHILCLYQTIYEIANKPAFFTNCRYWLKCGGYLVIHLVNKDRFNTVVPVGTPPLIDNPQKYASTRIVRTEVDFGNFEYVAKYDICDGKCSTFVETFTDAATRNVRQNERKLFMESEQDILAMAGKCGFSQVGKIAVETDEHQAYYILS
jgi:SAM-dependent methyltransferase